MLEHACANKLSIGQVIWGRNESDGWTFLVNCGAMLGRAGVEDVDLAAWRSLSDQAHKRCETAGTIENVRNLLGMNRCSNASVCPTQQASRS